jgi:hypothetical protein
MRYRAKMIGGTLDVRSRAGGGGAVITCTYPIRTSSSASTTTTTTPTPPATPAKDHPDASHFDQAFARN